MAATRRSAAKKPAAKKAAAPRRRAATPAADTATALREAAAAMNRLAAAFEALRAEPPRDPRAGALAASLPELAAAALAPSPSGPEWCDRFPTSRSLDDLADPFRGNARRFVAALRAAGATVSIAATLRPKQRAFLMHHAWRIAKQLEDPRRVPPMDDVPILWAHVDAAGQFDPVASRQAAQAMVDRYGIVVQPSLTSKHIAGQAMDISIGWAGTLEIAGADGAVMRIADGPRNGQNAALHLVGRGYGVIKLVSDPPHWSDDGH